MSTVRSRVARGALAAACLLGALLAAPPAAAQPCNPVCPVDPWPLGICDATVAVCLGGEAEGSAAAASLGGDSRGGLVAVAGPMPRALGGSGGGDGAAGPPPGAQHGDDDPELPVARAGVVAVGVCADARAPVAVSVGGDAKGRLEVDRVPFARAACRLV